MGYVAVKPINLSGNKYMPGEMIEDAHILPSRKRSLVRNGCIAEVTGVERFPVADLKEVKEGEEVRFFIPVMQEDDGDSAQVLSIPLTEGEIQHIFAIMQMNIEEAAKEIEAITNEDVLIVIHSTDNRQGVKRAAKRQAEKLGGNEAEKQEK